MITVFTAALLCGCKGGTPEADITPTGSITPAEQGIDEVIDYASSVKLDMSSDTVKQEVTVKTYVDGDTTHFHVPDSVNETGVLKARYLAINTPAKEAGRYHKW